jgi:hypothetical protein
MVKAKRSKATKKGSSPTDLYEVFPGLRFVINYNDIKTGGMADNGKAFTLSTVDDAEDLEQLPDMICNRSFTYKEALKLSAALGEAIKAVDIIKRKFAKLDELDCYIDSMQSTVDDFRRSLKDNLGDIDDGDNVPDLDGDLRDLEESLKNF